ncbi:MAG TPA: glucose-6-phosphate dehydrogenase [Candidatus Saccharimonadales bacterium]|nr:glucose-6-phosphate dehydrogenase [Candidatus Saccharimonadales bacterium]
MSNLDPTQLVIFGITGDLSRRYLLPALYHLCKDGLLPEQLVIIGTSRQALDLDDFLGHVEVCVLEQDKVCDPEVLNQLRALMRLVQLDPTNPEDYHKLKLTLDSVEDEFGTCMNRLYYLSIPPQLYAQVIQHLGEAELNASCAHGNALTRLVVEKPFGYDTPSAQELIDRTGQWFGEHQVFRIDHYLAKETVQDVLLFRQHNQSYETCWNSATIASIDIVAYEHLDVQGRSFYDEIGALRDLIQSHLLQLLALTTMELPEKDSSDSFHASKEQLLAALGAFPADQVATHTTRGQYIGYRDEVGNADSMTDTFAALELTPPIPRWKNTTFRIATGKALDAKRTEIKVTLTDGRAVHFRIQPEPRIAVDNDPSAVTDFSGVERPVNHPGADAYERVLIDAIRGDQTLFASSREVMACWHFVQPILDEWAKNAVALQPYEKGSDPIHIWRP